MKRRWMAACCLMRMGWIQIQVDGLRAPNGRNRGSRVNLWWSAVSSSGLSPAPRNKGQVRARDETHRPQPPAFISRLVEYEISVCPHPSVPLVSVVQAYLFPTRHFSPAASVSTWAGAALAPTSDFPSYFSLFHSIPPLSHDEDHVFLSLPLCDLIFLVCLNYWPSVPADSADSQHVCALDTQDRLFYKLSQGFHTLLI